MTQLDRITDAEAFARQPLGVGRRVPEGAMTTERPLVLCKDCVRGGNGLDPDPCSCGWRETESTDLGCYLGESIPEGAPRRQHPKLTRSQRRYQRWLKVGDCFESFRAFLASEAARAVR